MSNSKNELKPPKWMDNLLDWFCSERHIEILRGDLYELYHERLENGSKLKADLLFFTNVIDMMRPFAIKERNTKVNHIAMFRNHLKLTYRNFFNHKLYSLLNIGGLALGLASFILIFIYIQDEM
ncbi:MAG: permease prefix domain 2-containing transporter, partial [Bacteroidota bacterium]